MEKWKLIVELTQTVYITHLMEIIQLFPITTITNSEIFPTDPHAFLGHSWVKWILLKEFWKIEEFFSGGIFLSINLLFMKWHFHWDFSHVWFWLEEKSFDISILAHDQMKIERNDSMEIELKDLMEIERKNVMKIRAEKLNEFWAENLNEFREAEWGITRLMEFINTLEFKHTIDGIQLMAKWNLNIRMIYTYMNWTQEWKYVESMREWVSARLGFRL